MKNSSKKKTTWTDLKRQLADLDRPAPLGLIQDLYATSKNNQAFLHARFALSENLITRCKHLSFCPETVLVAGLYIFELNRPIFMRRGNDRIN